jgi:hypothetical protein
MIETLIATAIIVGQIEVGPNIIRTEYLTPNEQIVVVEEDRN